MEMNSKDKDNEEMDMDMSNCPDCQLQMLQHQQQTQNQNQAPTIHQHLMIQNNTILPSTASSSSSASTITANFPDHNLLLQSHPYVNHHSQNVRSSSNSSVILYDHQTPYDPNINLNDNVSSNSNGGTSRSHLVSTNTLLSINSEDFPNSSIPIPNNTTTPEFYHYSNQTSSNISSRNNHHNININMNQINSSASNNCLPSNNSLNGYNIRHNISQSQSGSTVSGGNMNTHNISTNFASITTSSHSNLININNLHNTANNNSSSASSVPSSSNNTPVSVDMCDLKSFCAACANLNPPNSTTEFYRSSLQRHSVYPPSIFYGQGMPVPGFSPVDTWGNCNSNDYAVGPYSYTATPDYYSSTVLPPPPPLPQFSASSNNLHNSASNNNENSISIHNNQLPISSSSGVTPNININNSCSFSFPSNTSTTNNLHTSDDLSNSNKLNNVVTSNDDCFSRKTDIQHQQGKDESSNNSKTRQEQQHQTISQRENHTKTESFKNLHDESHQDQDDDDDNVVPICISISSNSNSPAEDDESSSSSADSGSSFLSPNDGDDDDDDVIVEEEEDYNGNDHENHNLNCDALPSSTPPICKNVNIKAIDKEVEDNSSLQEFGSNCCTICQNPIGETNKECSSPQLSNILENIHDDITAEDLDISVSSGDIEIGGIEDEVNNSGHNNKSLAYNNSNRHNQFTISRLAFLLNLPTHLLLTNNKNNNRNSSKNISTIYNDEKTKSDENNSNFQNDIIEVDCDSELANLCSKCTKLAILVDTLEKELRINSVALKDLFPSHCIPKTVMNSQCGTVNNNDINSQSNNRCQSTQTEHLIISFQDNVTMTDELDFLRTKNNDDNCCISENNENHNIILLEEGKIGSSACTEDEDEEPVEFNAVITPSVFPLTYLCEECGLKLSSRKSLEIHLKRHHDELKICCSICSKGFISESSLQLHLRTHTKEKPYKCFNTKCTKSFSTKSNMLAHSGICKAKNHDEKTNCVVLAMKNDLSVSNNSSPQSTSTTSIAPNDNSSNVRKSASKSSTKLQCEKCGVSFRLEERLNRHIAKGCKPALQCIYCPKRLSKKSEMANHLLIHSNLRPISCPLCPYTAKVKSNLKLHMETHSEVRKFKCTICNKGFNRKQALDLHKNRHTGFKPFSCKCGKQFYDLSNASKCKCKPGRTKNPNIMNNDSKTK